MITIERKQPVTPSSCSGMEAFRAYKIVAGDCKNEANDVVVKIPSSAGGYFILNSTKGWILLDQEQRCLKVLPDLTVASINICYDNTPIVGE